MQIVTFDRLSNPILQLYACLCVTLGESHFSVDLSSKTLWIFFQDVVILFQKQEPESHMKVMDKTFQNIMPKKRKTGGKKKNSLGYNLTSHLKSSLNPMFQEGKTKPQKLL